MIVTDTVAAGLNAFGHALTDRLLSPAECAEIAALYDDATRFRTTVDMARHRFGSGQYRYFTHDLPSRVQALREALYPELLPIARDWAAKLGRAAPWPDDLAGWLGRCHEAGQSKSAQILLRYPAGGWNALHRDVFGDMVFPLQAVIGLNAPGADYTGGEFLSKRGWSNAPMRHGVSTVHSGRRHALGLVFHDAA